MIKHLFKMVLGLGLLAVLILANSLLANAHPQPNNNTLQHPNPIILTDAQKEYSLGLHLEFLEDINGQLTIADITSPEYEQLFKPSKEEVPNFGYTNSVYWIRFTVINKVSQNKQWYLEHSFASMQYISLYLPQANGKGFEQKEAGSLIAFNQRDIVHPNVVFKLILNQNLKQTVYLRFKTGYGMTLPLSLSSPDAFIHKSQVDSLIWGLFYGTLLIMIGYNLFLWLFVKEINYFYYIIFVISFLLLVSSYEGLTFQYLWPNQLWWNKFAASFFFALVNITALKFSSKFLNTHHYTPNLHKTINICLILWLLLAIQTPLPSSQLVGTLMAPLCAFGFLILLSSGFITWQRQYHSARYFLLAWTVFIITTAITILASFDILPNNLFTAHSFRVGFVLLILLLSVAQADRINTLKQEKEQLISQQNILLEQTVKERTNKLLTANKTLEQEIVKHKETADRLRKLSRAVEQSGNGVIITNLKAEIEFINPAFATTTGYAYHEVIGKNPRILKSGKTPLNVYNNLWNTITQGDVWHGELLNKKKNGELYWELNTISPVKSTGGNITHYLAIKEDITYRRQAEDALYQAKEMAQQAKIKADEANKAKSGFLTMMSHELRTPLNSILGYAQILRRDPTLAPHHKQSLATMEQSGNHLLTLINDILDLAKIESGKVSLIENDFNFETCLKAINEIVNVQAEEKGIGFQMVLKNIPTYIYGDEKRIRQILLNLLGNAIKFTYTGQVTCKIEKLNNNLENNLEHPIKLRVEIIDTGIGIAEKDLESIFNPFQQVGEQKQQIKGTGLGLAISDKLVQLMGGELQVKSTEGLGSTFWFDLTVTSVYPELEELSTIPKQQIIGIKHCNLCKEKTPSVLVIDDDDANRDIVVGLLTPVGFNITQANNGQQGLNQAIKWQPDVIITDLVMPIMDGFELINHIKQTPSLENTVIIASSASVYEAYRQKSVEVGCQAFLPKPFEANLLFNLLQEYLDIQWHYETVTNAVEDKSRPENKLKTFNLPNSNVIKDLIYLAMIADRAAIEEKLAALVKEDEQFKPLQATLQPLVEAFRFDEIEHLLESYLD